MEALVLKRFSFLEIRGANASVVIRVLHSGEACVDHMLTHLSTV